MSYIKIDKNMLEFELKHLVYPKRKIKDMNLSQIKNYLRLLEEYRLTHHIGDEVFLRTFKKTNLSLYLRMEEISKLLDIMEMWALGFKAKLEEEEKEIICLPKEEQIFGVSNRKASPSFSAKGNKKRNEWRRWQDLGLKPEDSLSSHLSGTLIPKSHD